MMNYYAPCYNDLGGIGEPMNPLFIDSAIALGPTRVMNVPDAGYVQMPQYGLDGRQFDRDYFAPGNWELSGRHGGSDFFAPGQWQLSGWRDAIDVFTAASFLFPE